MKNLKKIRQLGQLANLRADTALARTRAAMAAVEATQRLIAGLDMPAKDEAEVDYTEEKAAVSHAIWIGHRRSELNAVLARQKAEWLRSLDDARREFGRKTAIADLADRVKSAAVKKPV